MKLIFALTRSIKGERGTQGGAKRKTGEKGMKEKERERERERESRFFGLDAETHEGV